MNKVKLGLVFLFIFIFTFNIGCSKVNGKDTQSIKSPINDNLRIKGTWRITNIEIIDDQIENKEEILSQKDTLISISKNKVSIFNKSYDKPKFKLKVVNEDYILSYELKLKVKDVIKTEENLDTFSLIDNNNLIGEFIFQNENEGYLFYYGVILKLYKEDAEPRDLETSYEKIQAEVIDEDYNDDIGVMFSLKSQRAQLEDGSFSEERYRTIWIAFKDDKLSTVLEKENIIFPRLNGIWTIENRVETKNNNHIEYFVTKPLDGKEESTLLIDKSSNLYKDIRFVSNDYISIEKYEGNNFENSFSHYNLIPIDNINSNVGINLNDIYSLEVKDKFDISFKESLLNIADEEKNSLKTIIDYKNFSISRVEGKWRIIGKIASKSNDDKGLDFDIGISPSKKIINYNTLLIPWKDLKSNFPFIEDAYTSPTGRIAIIIANNNLFIYELENRSIKGSPLATIDLDEGETAIMAEWAIGNYVDNWSKAFKDGKEVNIEEK